MGELSELSVTELSAGLASGRFSAVEIAADVTQMCTANRDLGALAAFDPGWLADAAASADARRQAGLGHALYGIPFILKDNIDTAHLPTTGGTGALAGQQSKSTAPAAQRLADAGGLLAAKASMHELALGITSNNQVTGPVRNPYNPNQIPGGSSGGTASAVASRQFPAGLGTDTGGSVRIPAALCGLFGFRPTVGRYSGQGVLPISHTRDTIGPIARSMDDIELLDRLMAGSTKRPAARTIESLRLGVPRAHFWEQLDPAVATLAEQTLSRLKESGATLIEADLPSEILSLVEQIGFPVALFEVMTDIPAYFEQHGISLSMAELVEGVGSPDVRGLLESLLGDGAIPEAAYRAAIDSHRPKAQQLYAAYFEKHNVDAVIFPTTPLTARSIGEDETVMLNGEAVPTFPTYIRNTDLSSNLNAPGISLPIGLADDLPVGIELDGLAGADESLLAVATALASLLDPMPAPPGVK